MSWVTIIWSMVASACLTLALIYFLAWRRNRTAWAHLLFGDGCLDDRLRVLANQADARTDPRGVPDGGEMGAIADVFLARVDHLVRADLPAQAALAAFITGLRGFYLLLTLVGMNVNYRSVTSRGTSSFSENRLFSEAANGIPDAVRPVCRCWSSSLSRTPA